MLGRNLKFLRAAAVGLGAAAGLWLSLGITSSIVFAERSPEISMRWWPTGSAKVTIANRILQGDRPDLPRARALAQEALLLEPANAASSRTLAMVEALSGNRDRERRLFHYSESLSRRDVVTQMWLIEDCVSRDDITCALRHYDRALRTSESGRELMIPVLAAAANENSVAGPLSDLIAGRPPWWQAFLDQLIKEGTSPDTLALMVRRAKLNMNVESERFDLERTLWRLTTLKGYRQAVELYRSARGLRAAQAFIRDGGFEEGSEFGPFEWRRIEEPELSAVRQRGPDGSNTTLALSARNGRNGDVARQLLFLPPGRYSLSMIAGAIGANVAGRPKIYLDCIDEVTNLLSASLPESPSAGQKIQLDVIVPSSGCDVQWFRIAIAAGSEEPADPPWLDAIEFAPRYERQSPLSGRSTR